MKTANFNGLLGHLTSLSKLELLVLTNTNVTSEGVQTLHEALPRCRIVWDGGTIEPEAAQDINGRPMNE